MRVSLFVTCVVDQLRPSVGVATVQLLRRLGCEVLYDPRQTCCGQPAANSGHRRRARQVARQLLDVYAHDHGEVLLVPSGSCAAQIRHLPGLFDASDPWHDRAVALAARTVELSELLVDRLGVSDVGAHLPERLAWHDACHGLRDLGIHDGPRHLLSHVRGATLVEPDVPPTCCGFGGSFSVAHPELSVAMADARLAAYDPDAVDVIVSADTSCLLQLDGRLRATGSRLRTLHLAEVLGSGVAP